MTYFRELPDLEYQSFLSDRQRSNDYLRVKNLFRRGKLRDDISNVLTVFDKYEIPDGYRPDNVAEELYRNSGYDWVVLISAGIINVRNEWPISDGDLYTYVIQKYGDELYGTHHYITAEIKDSNDRLILSEGKLVNSTLQIPFPSYASEISFSDLNVQINYFVQSIQVTNGGSGYTSPPSVDISDPEGPNGISAEASANIDENGRVSSIDVISSGTQYKLNPTLTFSGGGGVGAAATTTLYPRSPNTVTANLYLHDENTLIKTEDYGIFEINEDVNIWTYSLDTNTLTNLEYSSNIAIVKDTIKYFAMDGYFKTIEIQIKVEITGVNQDIEIIVNSESINSTQVSYITYFDEKLNSYDTKYNVTQPVTNYEYEVELNNEKRLIYVLKPFYLQQFINDNRDIMRYKNSSQLVEDSDGNDIIRTENTRNTIPYGSTFPRESPSEVIVRELA